MDEFSKQQKSLGKELAKINKEIHRLGTEPKVNEDRLRVACFNNVDDLSPEEIYRLLKEEGAWFSGSYDGDVSLVVEAEESDVAYSNRIAQEKARRNQWAVVRSELVRRAKVAQDQIESLKQEKKEKFSDPEYIEYLRLQAKFKKETAQ